MAACATKVFIIGSLGCFGIGDSSVIILELMENRNLRHQGRSRQSIDGFINRGVGPGHTRVIQPRSALRLDTRAREQRAALAKTGQNSFLNKKTRKLPNNPITSRDMRLPKGASDNRRPIARHFVKTHRLRRWVFALSASLVVLIVAIGGFLFSKGYLQLRRVFTGGSSAVALNSDVSPSLLKGEGSGRVNILLLGIGGPGHDGADLTDTIIVASIDVVNKKIGLLSIPRDLWVREPNNYISEFGKLNAAYESGKYKYLSQINSSNDDIKAIKAGFQTIDQTVSSVIGLPINYNAVVNFHAFEQAVNAVGGITVDVPETLYDPTMAWMNNWNSVLAKKGMQQMNGYHALIYSRSRETSSDFARGERQRAVLLAVKDKALSAGTLSNPIKISDLMSALGNNVRTDIGINDMQRIYEITSKIPSSDITSVDLDKPPNVLVTTGRIGSQSVVKPTAGLFDYSAIKAFVRTTLRDGYLAKENALVKVLNGTGSVGLAQTVTDELKSYGYRTAKPDNAPGNNHQTTMLIDMSNGQDKYTKHYLEQRFSTIALNKLPVGVQTGGANFVIIVGQDQAQVD